MAAEGAAVNTLPTTDVPGRSPGADGRHRYAFFPVMFGVIRAMPGEGDEGSQPVDRVVMLSAVPQVPVLLSRGSAWPMATVMQELFRQDGAVDGPPPASKASVEAMCTVDPPEAEAGKEETEECPVCLDGLWRSEGEEEEQRKAVKKMPCGHKFHGECIEKWLTMRGICPLCRHRMPEEEKEEGKKGGEEGETGVDSEERRRRAVERAILASLTQSWTLDLNSILQSREQGVQQPQPEHHHHPIIDDLD